MSTPTDSARDELRALRERAYGRDADIHDDPAALARLSELEEQAAAASAAVIAATARIATNGGPARSTDPQILADAPGAAARGPLPQARLSPPPLAPDTVPTNGDRPHSAPAGVDEPVPLAATDGETDAAALPAAPEDVAADGDDAAAEEDSATAPARPWWRRRVPVLWAASVAAALLVGVGLTLLVQSLEAGRVGVLQVDPEADWPEQVWGGPTEDSLAFETFYGVSVLSQPQVTGDGTEGPVPCLIVFSGVGDNPSYLGGACGAGPFPAQAALVVGRQAPSELRDRFPEGTALQFVLDGSQVHVYAREPGLVQPTP